MKVIGTAGHVDHGKSAIIEALTGTHPDRLKEEQVRGMTIELGFGWMMLPTGEEIGIVDVPGHRDFLENMLAGATGLDAVLLVVAADEGMMPQTREHLAILDLLGISRGVVALSKTDLVPEADRLRRTEQQVREAMQDTVLANAPVVPVSVRTGTGLPALTAAIAAAVASAPQRRDRGRPRLPIDRVFQMAGFGTVVTGTLADGSFGVGDEVECLPSGITGRIRGVQTHRKQIERAQPGSRVALNLASLSSEDIERGSVLALRSAYTPTQRLDAQIQLLAEARAGLKHRDEIKFFIGSASTTAIVRLLGTEEAEPGKKLWAQVELTNPMVCASGDRFIIRRPSPAETIGGGIIVDPQPRGRHRRFAVSVLAGLEQLAHGAPADKLYVALESSKLPSLVQQAAQIAGLDAAQSHEALAELEATRRIVVLGQTGLATTERIWQELVSTAGKALSSYHANFPLRPGMPKEELKSSLGLETKMFSAVLDTMVNTGAVKQAAQTLAMPKHLPSFSVKQRAAVDSLLTLIQQAPYATPPIKECQEKVGAEVLGALFARGDLIKASDEVIFDAATYSEMKQRVQAHMEKHERITLAEVRDMFSTSRKYAQAFLERLDADGVTRRMGDYRVAQAPRR